MEVVIAVIVALIAAVSNIVGIVITAKNATNTAIINSNARAAQTEQKFKDDFDAIKKEQSEIKARLAELSETDSCCANLQKDVLSLQKSMDELGAMLNQLKAESIKTDELQNKTMMLTLRHTINEGYRIFKAQGWIDQNSKQSLLDIGDLYLDDLDGNTFAESELDYIRNEIPVK